MLDALRSIVGFDHVHTDADTIRENSTDATKLFHPADVIVFPGSAKEVSAIVQLANRLRIPVVSRGGGVGYAGGAIPVKGGIVISMRRLNRILEINRIDLLAVLEPGVITDDLHKAAEAKGLFYPPDPASLKQCSIGGNVAHNAGGPRAFKYGVTRQYLLGLEVVLPTGEIVETGGRVVKNATGYDLTDLMCGSEGTLGIITRLTLRLIPKPETSSTIMALFRTVRACATSATHLIEAGIIPSKLELIDSQSLDAIRQYIKDENIQTACALPQSAAAMLLIEVDGDRASVACSMDSVRAVVTASGAEVVEAENADDLWAIRRYMSPAVGRIRPNKINEDIVVPRSRVADYLEAMEVLQRDSGLPIVCFGHVGDGNLHVNLMIDEANPGERQVAERIKRRIFELAVEMGGTISGEHGIGLMKSEFLPLALTPETIDAMKRIKRALDPNDVLNPGKIFPMNIMLGPGLLTKMISHAKLSLPQEACGLLIGHGTNATRFIRAQNVLASETAYEIDPALLASTFRSLRESGETLVGIFHSHPQGPAEPSQSDLDRAYYPEAVHLIVSLAEPEHAQIRGFRIIDGVSYEIEVCALG